MQKEMNMDVKNDYEELQNSLNKNKLTKLKPGKAQAVNRGEAVKKKLYKAHFKKYPV